MFNFLACEVALFFCFWPERLRDLFFCLARLCDFFRLKRLRDLFLAQEVE